MNVYISYNVFIYYSLYYEPGPYKQLYHGTNRAYLNIIINIIEGDIMKVLLLLAILTSNSLFAATMGDHRKLEKAEVIISESRHMKNYIVEKAELGFASYSLRHAIPIIGQIDALFDYGKEGDQDIDGYTASLSYGDYDFTLSCVLRSERKDHRDKSSIIDGIENTVSLERCDLKNIQTGVTKNIGYIGFERWVVKNNGSGHTSKRAIFQGEAAFPKEQEIGAGAGYGYSSGSNQ
jgi:hypothetical protein